MGLSHLIKKSTSLKNLINKPLIKRSLIFAYEAHKNQKRHSGEDYISHPVEVVKILSHANIRDEEVIAAGFLHDVIEKTDVTLNEFKRKFGKSVFGLVKGVTKLEKIHYQGNVRLRQLDSIKKLFFTMSRDPRVILVKLADRLHNMRTLACIPDKKKKNTAIETLEIYSPVANILGLREWSWELEDLSFKFLHSGIYEKISKKFGGVLQNISGCVNRIEKKLSACAGSNIIFKIKPFKKHNYHIYRTQQKKGPEFDAVRDSCAIKIITNTADNCYKLLGFIHGFYPPRPTSIKDYIAVPKINGYQALHTVVFGPEDTMLHIQIQTEGMYKHPKTFDVCKLQQGTFIKNILSIHKRAKNPEEFIRQMKLDMLGNKIFVFSSKGKIIDLPENSTCVDFAYAMHSNAGNYLKEVMVNGIKMPPCTKLKTGDIVKIVINKKIAGPCLEWLEEVKTIKARHYISKWHKSIKRDSAIKQGRKKIDKSLRVLLGTTLGRSKEEICQKIRAEKSYMDIDELFEMLGRGMENPNEVLAKIYPEKYLLRSEAQKNLSVDFYKKMHTKPVKLIVKADDVIGMLNKLTQCIAIKDINIEKITTATDKKDKSVMFEFIVAVENFKQLYELVMDLKRIYGVKDICKV